MKFTTSTAYLTALAALASTSSAASCVQQSNIVYTYIVRAEGVPNIPEICGGLWDNLHRFAACPPSATSCGPVGPNGLLEWKFNVGLGCNSGMIESTWWEATRNNFGSIDCP